MDKEKQGWTRRLRQGLLRSSQALKARFSQILHLENREAENLIEELENVLIEGDFGLESAESLSRMVVERAFSEHKEVSSALLFALLAEEIEKILLPVEGSLQISAKHQPHILLVVGVNGVGKTTTIGKLAAQMRAEGKKVLLVAGDTFRAAAIEQLTLWAQRAGCEIFSREVGSDAAGLIFDAITKGKAEGYDVLLIDTAGRLQNKTNLMEELQKIRRVIQKQDPAAPHDVLLILDATTGLNSLDQVEIFQEIAKVTGLIMTKLDGTARGGILIPLASRKGLSVHAIGVGEGIEDLQSFSARDFAQALLPVES